MNLVFYPNFFKQKNLSARKNYKLKRIHTNGKRLNGENKRRGLVANTKNSRRAIKQKGLNGGGSYSIIRAWFRSRDLWVMGPPRYPNLYNVTLRQSSVPISLFLLRLCLSFPSCTNTIKKLLGKQFKTLIENPQKISIKEALFNKKKGNEKETWYWWVTNSSCCKANYCFFCWIDSLVSIWLFINVQYK